MRPSHMPLGSGLLMAPVVFAALTAASGVVWGQTAPSDRAAAVPGAAERQRLRAELQRVNAEIDTLKRDKRGLGDEYRLRGRMADAEALARRLTELDARMGRADRGAAGQGDGAWPSAPEARPSDDRIDLEAKADILSDQARRLNGQANVLAERVTALRGRQELRRRAGQLERDPFSPLEQVKRRTATPRSGTFGVTEGAGPASGAKTNDATGAPNTPVVSPPTTTPGGSTPSGAGAVPTPPGVTGVTTGAADQTARAASTSTTAGLNTPPAAIPIGAAMPGDAAGSVASQFRGILDAATLAEIRRLEVPGSPAGNLQAMERALSALRTRAAQLTASAGALRTQARSGR